MVGFETLPARVGGAPEFFLLALEGRAAPSVFAHPTLHAGSFAKPRPISCLGRRHKPTWRQPAA